MKFAGHVARMWEMGGGLKSFDGLTRRRERELERLRRRWEDNIKTNVKGIGWECVDWVDLALCKNKCRDFMNAVMNFRVP